MGVTCASEDGGGRRMRWRSVAGAAALAAACAIAGAGSPPEAAAAGAPDLITSHRVLSVGCVSGAAHTVKARVRVRMRVVNYEGFGGDWADHMEVKARLEPTTAGHNLFRSWRSQKSNNLVINRTHTRIFDVTTDNVGSGDWKVHVKLIWHRPAPDRNVKRDVYFRFSCAPMMGVGM